MESAYLQDLVSDLCFDNNPLEDTKSFVDLLSDKDLLLFDSDPSFPGELIGEHGGHIQQGVIHFSVSKILNTIEHQPPDLQIAPNTNTTSTPAAGTDQAPAEPDASPAPDNEDLATSLSCAICSKPALRYSSYGGQACTSCRSFFRRSARNDVHLNYK